jgi:hypothetical protein
MSRVLNIFSPLTPNMGGRFLCPKKQEMLPSMAQAFDRNGAAAKQRWQQIAALLVHRGRDPNWRRRPSVFDQLRGWNRQPVVRKQTNRGHLKAAA